ncbi:hypothetical protein C7E12_15305, partial [Stenotrophomonas maltophilia]
HAQHAQRLRRQPTRATRTDDLDFARGQSDGALSYPYPIGYRGLDFAAVHFLLHSRDRSRAVFAFDTAPSWEQRKARLRTKHRRIPQKQSSARILAYASYLAYRVVDIRLSLADAFT